VLVAVCCPLFALFVLRYNLVMNKRAKKRLKESIAKDKQERKESLPQQRPGASKDPRQQKGFLPKPEKKRG
jgi:hypothetical protein